MKILKLFLVLVVVSCAAAFGYFAVADIPVKTSKIITTIPNERFFENTES